MSEMRNDVHVRGHRVDRLDAHGNIREHYVDTAADRTLCGLTISAGNTQQPLGNGTCARCKQLARGRLWTAEAVR